MSGMNWGLVLMILLLRMLTCRIDMFVAVVVVTAVLIVALVAMMVMMVGWVVLVVVVWNLVPVSVVRDSSCMVNTGWSSR